MHVLLMVALFVAGFCGLCRILVMVLEHRSDRTSRYCPKCGWQLFPERGQLWSTSAGWHCQDCGAWGDCLSSCLSWRERQRARGSFKSARISGNDAEGYSVRDGNKTESGFENEAEAMIFIEQTLQRKAARQEQPSEDSGEYRDTA